MLGHQLINTLRDIKAPVCRKLAMQQGFSNCRVQVEAAVAGGVNLLDVIETIDLA